MKSKKRELITKDQRAQEARLQLIQGRKLRLLPVLMQSWSVIDLEGGGEIFSNLNEGQARELVRLYQGAAYKPPTKAELKARLSKLNDKAK